MKNLIYIAFRSFEGPTLISKATRNENGTLELVDYNPEYVEFDQSNLNKESAEKLNSTVSAKWITEISEETYNSLTSQDENESTSDVFIQPVEIKNEAVENMPVINGSKVEAEIDYYRPGYYQYNPKTEKYEYTPITKEIAEELHEDGISHIYVNNKKECFTI